MSLSSTPLNHCPDALVPIMLEILAARNAAMPSAGQGIHEKTVEMSGTEYDQLMVLFYNAFGSPFSCQDPQKGVTYTLSFVNKPAVVRETIANAARHYTIHVKLAKLPTAPGSGGSA
ncbi:MAG: hypothetical protein K0S58_2601 [Nitrospira sp.]|nr:hypothetical protein [Nitrospira sp.]